MNKQGELISLNTRIQFIKRKRKMNTVVKGLIHYHDSMPQEIHTGYYNFEEIKKG